MPPLGRQIFRSDDALGPILVFQRGNRRVLTFGTRIEQSCVDIGEPARLEYAYTQAMMLGSLLVPALTRATILGLGGGSLARALLQHFPACRVDAVELRQPVVDIARSLFFLPEDARLRIHIGDAESYLEKHARCSDLIFADLYLARHMDERQTEEAFLRACRQALSENGVLVANLWRRDYLEAGRNQRVIAEVFDQRLLYLHVPDGNDIAFAFAGTVPTPTKRDLLTRAEQLGTRMNIPLLRFARGLRTQNPELLQLARYRR